MYFILIVKARKIPNSIYIGLRAVIKEALAFVFFGCGAWRQLTFILIKQHKQVAKRPGEDTGVVYTCQKHRHKSRAFIGTKSRVFMSLTLSCKTFSFSA